MKKEDKEALIFWGIFGGIAIVILTLGIWALANVDKW